MRKVGYVVLLLLAALIQAQEGPAQREARIDKEHTKWVDSVMRSISSVKPGATRKNLLGVFTEEGGLSTRTHRTYVYKHCPYIKVDVEFAPVGNEDDALTEMPEDKISTISRPYLQYFIAD
jgi:hypothetical protein